MLRAVSGVTWIFMISLGIVEEVAVARDDEYRKRPGLGAFGSQRPRGHLAVLTRDPTQFFPSG